MLSEAFNPATRWCFEFFDGPVLLVASQKFAPGLVCYVVKNFRIAERCLPSREEQDDRGNYGAMEGGGTASSEKRPSESWSAAGSKFSLYTRHGINRETLSSSLERVVYRFAASHNSPEVRGNAAKLAKLQYSRTKGWQPAALKWLIRISISRSVAHH